MVLSSTASRRFTREKNHEQSREVLHPCLSGHVSHDSTDARADTHNHIHMRAWKIKRGLANPQQCNWRSAPTRLLGVMPSGSGGSRGGRYHLTAFCTNPFATQRTHEYMHVDVIAPWTLHRVRQM